MKRFTYFAAALVLTAAAASAQPPQAPGGRGGPPDIERLTVLLDLDAYQKGEVERILTEQRAAMRATREQHVEAGERPSREDMQARREQGRAELITKLQAVLTESQIAKFKVLTERSMGPRGGERERGGE
jgi:hypothetical protein